MNNNIFEGLEKNDLKRLIEPNLRIDEYKSKMGKDEDIIVISFSVVGKPAAEDLVSFVEKGYDWVIDADISSGELENGNFLVFVECDRDPGAAENIIKMMNEIMNLTDQSLSEWQLYIRSSNTSHDLTAENIKKFIPLTSEEYLRQFGKKSIDEMKTAAGVAVTTTAPKNDFTQNLRSLAGLL